ncbi:MAG: class I SAM-dependent methyltransferase [Chloroflexota bacterium]|nr:class I SAM-dependent methyltransferase [Chloroflexota bacterium]
MGLRSRWWNTFFGVPRGVIGRLGARIMLRSSPPFNRGMAAELGLQPDDELLDVGCGSGGMLLEHASQLPFVAGIDASEIQLGRARERLAERIVAGTAEIVLGDAAALPWEDGRFSAVTSINAMKFFPDPAGALREMYRVLRPGGRLAITMGEAEEAPKGSTEAVMDAWGQWQWSDAAAQELLEEAGFTDVAVSVMPVFSKALLAGGTKPATTAV